MSTNLMDASAELGEPAQKYLSGVDIPVGTIRYTHSWGTSYHQYSVISGEPDRVLLRRRLQVFNWDPTSWEPFDTYLTLNDFNALLISPPSANTDVSGQIIRHAMKALGEIPAWTLSTTIWWSLSLPNNTPITIKLPPQVFFQNHIDKLREDPDFWDDDEASEIFCCKEAMKLIPYFQELKLISEIWYPWVAHMPKPTLIRLIVVFTDRPFPEQQRLVPEIDDWHTGATFARACRLAYFYIEWKDLYTKNA